MIEELLMAGESFVVIERDPEIDQRARRSSSRTCRSSKETQRWTITLEEAGIDKARGLIACLSKDTDNLFVCLSARDQRKDLEIVARAYEEETVPKLYRAGANHVVSPNASGAIRMASYMLRPVVVSFLDVATRSPDLTLRMEQETVSESSPHVGKTLADIKLPQYTGLIVIGIRKKNPPEAEEDFDLRVQPPGRHPPGPRGHHDRLGETGSDRQAEEVREPLSREYRKPKRPTGIPPRVGFLSGWMELATLPSSSR